MEVEAGWLEMQQDGCLTGVLRTLTLNIHMELRPVVAGTYQVRVAGGWIMGSAAMRPTTRTIDIDIRSPELHGPIRLRAEMPDDGREWRLAWTPPAEP
ncbi:DUF736 family protein [Sphingomonas panni]|uniref:DUF736 family protein n=1 Tax=Sphingomonas panni TaxID=237612 RepID=UPI001F5B3CC2|nr:DUF736 family protein [Sphingomonas panni]